MEDQAVSNFREYVRINTMHPNPDYGSAVVWLKNQAAELDADFYVTECVPSKPIVVMTILGKDSTLPSVLLNSHTDVVPVILDHWKYEPFSAFKDANGNIYGRGTQDMKCVGVQYIEALKKLKKEGIQLLRTVHLTFVPDEEIGGFDGMQKFVKTEEFKQLNVGFALDEGYASSDENFLVFNGEKNMWQFYVKCPGNAGHGSQLLSNTPGQKIRRIIDCFLSFRDAEEKRLQEDSNLSLGNVVTVNMTLLEGGVQFNVVPDEFRVGFDVRIPPDTDLKKFEDKLLEWCKEVGDDVSIDFYQKTVNQVITCVDDGKSKWWDAFRTACDLENITLKKNIFPGGTDCRYVRESGIPALGFSPMNNTPRLLHDHNEYINEKVFLRGIEIYKTILVHVANVK